MLRSVVRSDSRKGGCPAAMKRAGEVVCGDRLSSFCLSKLVKPVNDGRMKLGKKKKKGGFGDEVKYDLKRRRGKRRGEINGIWMKKEDPNNQCSVNVGREMIRTSVNTEIKEVEDRN